MSASVSVSVDSVGSVNVPYDSWQTILDELGLGDYDALRGKVPLDQFADAFRDSLLYQAEQRIAAKIMDMVAKGKRFGQKLLEWG